jgi:hypothetical protein
MLREHGSGAQAFQICEPLKLQTGSLLHSGILKGYGQNFNFVVQVINSVLYMRLIRSTQCCAYKKQHTVQTELNPR